MKIEFKCPTHKKNLVEKATVLRFQDNRAIERRLYCPNENCKFWVLVKEYNTPAPKLSKKREKEIKETLKKLGMTIKETLKSGKNESKR
jgi:hypothetical protein